MGRCTSFINRALCVGLVGDFLPLYVHVVKGSVKLSIPKVFLYTAHTRFLSTPNHCVYYTALAISGVYVLYTRMHEHTHTTHTPQKIHFCITYMMHLSILSTVGT